MRRECLLIYNQTLSLLRGRSPKSGVCTQSPGYWLKQGKVTRPVVPAMLQVNKEKNRKWCQASLKDTSLLTGVFSSPRSATHSWQAEGGRVSLRYSPQPVVWGMGLPNLVWKWWKWRTCVWNPPKRKLRKKIKIQINKPNNSISEEENFFFLCLNKAWVAISFHFFSILVQVYTMTATSCLNAFREFQVSLFNRSCSLILMENAEPYLI